MALDVSGQVSELDQSLSLVETPSVDIDSEGAQKETTWQTENWTIYNGYYKEHNPVKGTINKLGAWSTGRGYEAEESVMKILNRIRGWGKESFDDILNNQIRVRHINGDSYAEIIRDKAGRLSNLKPLNPGRIIHVVNSQGMLKRYDWVRSDGSKQPFKPSEIFHLVLNRDADEIHGTGDIESIRNYLDKIKQLDEDMSTLFHRFVVPAIMFKLDTDNTTKIASYKTNMDKALNTGQNIYVPQGAVEHDVIEGKGTTADPMEWRRTWIDEVVRSGGVPALIMAQEAGSTEASSKMVVFTWQQVIRDEQKYVETQVKQQLGLEINLIEPESIEDSVEKDEKKDGSIKGEKKSEVKATPLSP